MQMEYREQIQQLKSQIEKESKLRTDAERQSREWMKAKQQVEASEEEV